MQTLQDCYNQQLLSRPQQKQTNLKDKPTKTYPKWFDKVRTTSWLPRLLVETRAGHKIKLLPSYRTAFDSSDAKPCIECSRPCPPLTVDGCKSSATRRLQAAHGHCHHGVPAKSAFLQAQKRQGQNQEVFPNLGYPSTLPCRHLCTFTIAFWCPLQVQHRQAVSQPVWEVQMLQQDSKRILCYWILSCFLGSYICIYIYICIYR